MEHETKKILFLLSNLSGIGGIESSFYNLLHGLTGHTDMEISVCVLGNNIKRKEQIPENVKIVEGNKLYEYIALNWKNDAKKYGIFERIRILFVKFVRRMIGAQRLIPSSMRRWRIAGNYDSVISFTNNQFNGSFMGGCEEAALYSVSANRKIAWIHNDIRKLEINHDNSYERYNQFDLIVNVSKACKNLFDAEFPEFKEKSTYAYNICDISTIEKKANEEISEAHKKEGRKYCFTTVCRLRNEQKRVDKIIQCASMLVKNGHSDFVWYIVGTGPDEAELIAMRDRENLQDFVVFAGYQNNPYPYIKAADLYIMTSDYEAYSMTLIEALALGKPLISTEYPGVEEIIRSNENGFVCGRDAESMYGFLCRVFDDDTWIEQIKNNISQASSTNNALKRAVAVLNGNWED